MTLNTDKKSKSKSKSKGRRVRQPPGGVGGRRDKALVHTSDEESGDEEATPGKSASGDFFAFA